MMKIKITGDSTCDLSPELIAKYDFGITPITIVKGDEQFKDGLGITPDDIYEYFDSGKGICSTSASNVSDYLQEFGKYAADYDAIIHFGLGSKISSSYQNAMVAAAQFDNIYVIDTESLSSAIGYMMITAAEMVKEGKTPEEIVAAIKTMIPKMEISFVVDKLDYLHKGGRCSSVSALATGLLKIKPCIELTDGSMKVGKKYRGSIEHCIKLYVADRLKNREDIDTKRLFITHSKCDPQLVEAIRTMCAEHFDFEEVYETVAGCTVTSHCGPNTLGIIFCRK